MTADDPDTDCPHPDYPKADCPDRGDARLQACLDARRDPLDDPELCELLADDPAQLQAFARLQASLRSLPVPTPNARRANSRPGRWPLAAGIAAAGIAAAAMLVMLVAEAPWAEAPWSGAPWSGAPWAGANERETPRILMAQLQELQPRAYCAATVTLHQQLVTTETTRLESYERWSSRR